MKNSKKFSVIILFIFSYIYGHSNDFYTHVNDSNCMECNLKTTSECSSGLGDFESLEFASLYKYNSNKFTSCDFNTSHTESSLEANVNSIAAQLEAHNNHLHQVTTTIKKQHKNSETVKIQNTLNYVMLLDTSSTQHKEVIDYGIKLKL